MGADKKSFLLQNQNRPSDGYHLLSVHYHVHIYSPKNVISVSHMKNLRQTGLREVNSCALVPPMTSSLSKPRVWVPTLGLPQLPPHVSACPKPVARVTLSSHSPPVGRVLSGGQTTLSQESAKTIGIHRYLHYDS